MIPTVADKIGGWMGINSQGYSDGSEANVLAGAVIGMSASTSGQLVEQASKVGSKLKQTSKNREAGEDVPKPDVSDAPK